MTELLFDTPWWLPVAIAVAGVVIFISGNRRVEQKIRLAGVAVICLAVLLAAVSYYVDTPRETALRRSKGLVDAFERGDFATMSSILHPDTAVTLHGAEIYRNRDEIMAGAKTAHSKYGFKSVNVLFSNAEQVQTSITVTITVLSEQNAMASTLNSEWQFDWEQRAEGWSLVEVRALKIGSQQGDQIRGMFPNR